MILQDIRDYKLKLWLYINAVCAAGATTFLGVLLVLGPANMIFPIVVAITYFAVVIYLLHFRKIHLWKGRGSILIVPSVFLASVIYNPQFGVYWTFVGAVCLFFLLELKDACITVIVFALMAFYFLDPHLSDEALYRFYATFLLVGFFSFCFAYLIENLLKTLDQLATEDPLTKARNRHTFNRSITGSLNEHQRYGTVTALLIFDLDHFKAVNDTYGHLVGDKILQGVADIVRTRLRDTDLFFRYGGEEFAILMRHTLLQSAAHVANELRERVESHTFEGGIRVTISGGLAEVQEKEDVPAWVARCDAALYDAKANGRNRIEIDIPKFNMWPDGGLELTL